jgi:molybdate transport system substrate-binding protein
MKTLLLALAVTAAQAADVHFLCSNGMKSVVEEVQPTWEKATGNKLIIEYSSANSLREKMAAGAAFDVTILSAEVATAVLQSKFIGAPKPIAKGGIGVGVRKGAAKPDLKSADGLKKFLLAAKSIIFTENGASRPTIDKMFEKLGIAAALKPKIQLVGPGIASERVAEGKAEVVLTLMSEILPIPGVELAGPLPAEYQGYVSFSGALSAKPAQAKAAQAFLDYLATPAVTTIIKAKGLER